MRTEQHEALNSEEFNEEEEEPVFEDAQSEIDDLDGLKVVGFHREVSFNPGFRASSNYEREHKMHLALAANTNSPGRTRNVENFNKKGSSLFSEKIDRGVRPNEEHLLLQKSSFLSSQYATNHFFPKLELVNIGKNPYGLSQTQSHGFRTLEEEAKGKIYHSRNKYIAKNQIASVRDEGTDPQVHNLDYQTSKNHTQSARVVSLVVAKEEESHRTLNGTSNTERFSTIHSSESRNNYSQKNLAGEFTHNILEKYERSDNPARLSNVSTEQPSSNSKSPYNSGKKSLIDTTLEAKVNEITAKILRERELAGTGKERDILLSTNLTASTILLRHDPYSISSFNSIGLGAPTSETGRNEGGYVSKTRVRSEGQAFKSRNIDLSPENKSLQDVKDPNYNVHFGFSSVIKSDIHQTNNGANQTNANIIQRKNLPAKIWTGFREKFCSRKKSKRLSSKDTTPKPNVITNTERSEVVTINSQNSKKRTLKAYRPLLVCLCAITYYLLFLIYSDAKR